jgi:Tol biopolymer transport system component
LTGTTVSHYEILERLGGGGMGVVYKARDTRLGRTVALKFVPPELTRDPEAKERFLREARAASALDHPNLCTVYEIGETGEGRLFLAMARYDGETLKKRLERGPLPVEEAVDVARQVAQGLAKAHRHGIVHRDVKPANLMLTSDGVVKILDFGLAKLAGTAGITREGSALGTPAYMAPEQARGEEVDARADVWSLGAVCYEMLAGRRPFPGEPEAAALYAVLHEEPKPLSSLRPGVPPELARIVGRMLAKDPAARYASAAEVLAEIKAHFGPASGSLPTTARVPPRAVRPRLWAASLALAALAGTYLLLPFGGRTAKKQALQATFTRLTEQVGGETFPSLAPDGGFFVYVRADGGDLDVFLQRVGGGNPINLTADSAADDTQPAFSPDGQQIAFRSERDGGGVFLMGATGESVRRLTDFGYNPAWSPDGGKVLVATEGVTEPRVRNAESEVWQVEVATGAGKLVIPADAVQPSWSPNGRRIAYWENAGGKRVVRTLAAAGGPSLQVTDDAYVNWSPVWSPDGQYVYFASDRGGSMNLWRVPIDESSGRLQGAPEAILTPAPWSGLPSLSRDGRKILYATREGKANLERFALDPATGRIVGPPVPVTRGPRTVGSGAVSPDGGRVVFHDATPQEDLYVVRSDGSGLRRLTHDAYKDRNPRWLPGGDRILFYSNRGGTYQAWTIRPDGSGLTQVTAGQADAVNPIASPDGGRVLCSFDGYGAAIVDLAQPLGRRTPRPLPSPGDPGEDFVASSWSADGRRLAGNLALRGSLQPGIVVYSFAPRTYERLTDHGIEPVWLPDGRRLVYGDGGGIWMLDTRTRASRELLTPSASSAVNLASVAPDGKSLYVVRTFDEGDLWMLTLQ